MKKHKNFEREIAIFDKQFQFEDNDHMVIVGITKTGYHHFITKDDTEISRTIKLSLDKLNNLLPDDMQLTKDHIIYILTADKD
jgi:hypothetical protein